MADKPKKQELLALLERGEKREKIFNDLSPRYGAKAVAKALARIPTNAAKAANKHLINFLTYLLYLQLLISVVTCVALIFYPELLNEFPVTEEDGGQALANMILVGVVSVAAAVNLTLVYFMKKYSVVALHFVLVFGVLGLKSQLNEFIAIALGKTPISPWLPVDVLSIIANIAIIVIAFMAVKRLRPDVVTWGRPRQNKEGKYLFTEDASAQAPLG